MQLQKRYKSSRQMLAVDLANPPSLLACTHHTSDQGGTNLVHMNDFGASNQTGEEFGGEGLKRNATIWASRRTKTHTLWF